MIKSQLLDEPSETAAAAAPAAAHPAGAPAPPAHPVVAPPTPVAEPVASVPATRGSDEAHAHLLVLRP